MGVDTVQGYGRLRRRSFHVGVIGVLVVLVSAGCSLTSGTDPSRIVLPPTDVLSTESEVETTTTAAAPSTPDTAVALPDWTIGRVIALAPRVDNSHYHQGSVRPNSPIEDTSGFHFTTPDRRVNCSTGTNGSATLACRLNTETRGNPPADTPSSCRWARNLVTLSTDDTQRGACANRYPVLYRSTIVDYGHTISISRFSCLVESAGMYCLESRSKSGFAITPRGYLPIAAGDRAPSALTGIPESASESEVATAGEGNQETPVPSPPTS
ncbi:hypothetical protein G3I13_13230 [Streptomyces sp. SID6673]|nr:hypothetical protein [Streptomyces sp. SID11726]NEB25301.1 hypothetical protein [Streptomyces sp. SID6673]